MARYSVVFKQSVAKDLRRLPTDDIARILKRIEALADDPHPPGSEKLSGQSRYRLRQGVYRILYSVEADMLVITVVKVAHRREVYR
jgi:mRNA interferase RelE/StbE